MWEVPSGRKTGAFAYRVLVSSAGHKFPNVKPYPEPDGDIYQSGSIIGPASRPGNELRGTEPPEVTVVSD